MGNSEVRPDIYALLVCSQVERNADLGGWQLQPLSHIAVSKLPVSLDLVIFAAVMAPPGDYRLSVRIFHTEDDDAATLVQPLTLTVQPGKNVEYIAQVAVTLRCVGLYVIEATLDDHFDIAYSPLRISQITD